MISQPELITLMREIISKETKIPLEEIEPSHSFFELGLDSISAIFMMEKLEQYLNVSLNPIHFWDYPTIEKYANYVVNEALLNGKK